MASFIGGKSYYSHAIFFFATVISIIVNEQLHVVVTLLSYRINTTILGCLYVWSLFSSLLYCF